MSAALHLAGPDDLDRLAPMVAAYHAHEGIDTPEEQRRTALAPILDGSLPFAVAYLIGPRRSFVFQEYTADKPPVRVVREDQRFVACFGGKRWRIQPVQR
jgi:hypothetical protein